ncbi:MAG: SDR family oxidoreductase [Pseudomonadota bacterium]
MTEFGDLKQKTAVITGANGGMGVAVAAAMAKVGMNVVASDVQDEACPELAAESGILYKRADVSKEQDIIELMEFSKQQFGNISCAVNGAAVEFELGRLAECKTDDFDRLMGINLRGVFLCMKYQILAMLENGGGTIVNMASSTALKPGQLQPAYTASKYGVAGLTQQAAVDYAADGIRINAIAPGNIDTPMLRRALDRRKMGMDVAKEYMPLRRWGTPQEIANAALWLSSDASSFTVGHVLTVEGGMILN